MDQKNMKIVSIDDNENNLFLIEALCSELELKVTSFTDPVEGLLYTISNDIDMIIIDYMMPDLDGIEFIKEYRQKNQTVPIIMVTAAGNDENIHNEAFIVGVNDFLSKPVNATLFKARVLNLLKLYQNTMLLEDKAKHLSYEVDKATNSLIQREHETLQILGKTAEYKDPETASHVARVAHYSKLLALKYGLNQQDQDIIFYASPFHDLGKVGIDDKILLKPGKLDNDEFDIMKTHATIGYEILKNSNSEYLKAGASIAITHHEKYDGSGYPNNLKGDDIDIFGRIVAVVDVFDALTSTRPYKKAWKFDDAVDLLKKESGKHFDPQLVTLFIENIDEVKSIFNSFKEV
ncbi:MAG: response regulator [Campylobacterota bacterium]|nr:response regulator [Campylobacterota bacterium]